jgi:branched-chain amino acid transport system ATP-binding protein
MEVIVSLTQRVLVFNQGHVIAEGAPREVMADARVIEAYLGRSQSGERRRRRSAK